MKKKVVVREMIRNAWVAIVAVWAGDLVATAAPTQKPNVVIIYGDDVGYGDVGAYGSKMIPTPNIDRLSKEGLLYTDGHCSAATCSQI